MSDKQTPTPSGLCPRCGLPCTCGGASQVDHERIRAAAVARIAEVRQISAMLDGGGERIFDPAPRGWTAMYPPRMMVRCGACGLLAMPSPGSFAEAYEQSELARRAGHKQPPRRLCPVCCAPQLELRTCRRLVPTLRLQLLHLVTRGTWPGPTEQLEHAKGLPC